MEDEKLFYFVQRMTLERSKDEGEKRVYDFKWSCTAGCWLAGWLAASSQKGTTILAQETGI
jgi:hypothetical protein